MNPIAVLVGGVVLFAGIAAWRNRHTVTVNGRKWILEKQPEGFTIVSSPAMQFGPHEKMPVLTFSEEATELSDGSPWTQRWLEYRYPGIPAAIDAAALSDLGISERS